jgi:uncharacterized membrane protein
MQHVTRTITILSEPDPIYQFWHDFENLPRFMYHLERVTSLGNGRSHWVAKGPNDSSIEWEAEITEDRPGELIAWRSVDGSEVQHSGSVTFQPAPGDRGTEVKVDLEYDPPGGKFGSTIAKLFGEEPSVQVADDLRRFKQVVETGDVVLSDGSQEGVGQAITDQDPSQPAEPLVAREVAP